MPTKRYGKEHRALRTELAAVVASGGGLCCRCHGPIGSSSDEPCLRCGRIKCGYNTHWDVDHLDKSLNPDGEVAYRDGPTGPMAHSCCNRYAGASAGGKARVRKNRVRVWSRRWLSED